MDNQFANLLDFLLTIPSRAFLAIPFFVLAMALLLANASLVFLMLGIYSWAWVVVTRRVRAHVRVVSGAEAKGRVSTRSILPAILSSTLLVAKFAVVASIIWQAGLNSLGLGSREVTWGGMLKDAHEYGAYMDGEWILILPPILGFFLVTASIFVVLDRLEAVANSMEAERNADAVTVAAQEAKPISQ